VFDSTFTPVRRAVSFLDPGIPAGFAPFGIRNLGGLLYVTYAKQDAVKHDDDKRLGNGYVDIFDLNGNLVRRFASQGTLNSPWGLAIAPTTFGHFHDDLLVGNFGDSRISGFDLASGPSPVSWGMARRAIQIDGLWGLRYATAAAAVTRITYPSLPVPTTKPTACSAPPDARLIVASDAREAYPQ
jgi:uncharacterized protein (TIGR03118 family)